MNGNILIWPNSKEVHTFFSSRDLTVKYNVKLCVTYKLMLTIFKILKQLKVSHAQAKFLSILLDW